MFSSAPLCHVTWINIQTQWVSFICCCFFLFFKHLQPCVIFRLNYKMCFSAVKSSSLLFQQSFPVTMWNNVFDLSVNSSGFVEHDLRVMDSCLIYSCKLRLYKNMLSTSTVSSHSGAVSPLCRGAGLTFEFDVLNHWNDSFNQGNLTRSFAEMLAFSWVYSI